jgi:hypothetical protein
MSMRDRDSMRGRYSQEEDEELPASEDEFLDIDLDEILEVDEDEIEEEFEDGDACPPGCAPVEEKDVDVDVDVEKEEDDEDEESSEGEEKEDEDDKDEKEAAVEPKQEEKQPKPSAKWSPLFTEADVKTLEDTKDFAMYLYADTEDPHYVVIANGKPVGQIHMSDVVRDEDGAELFLSDDYAKGITQIVEQMGLHETLDDMNVRYYAAQVTDQAASNAAKHQVQADLEQAYQTRQAEMKQKFVNNLLLAVEASLKNVFVKNQLRDAIRQNFRGAGVPDAVIVDLFEDAMHTAGADYLNGLIGKAEEWLGFESDALAQVEASIKEADYSHPVDRGLKVEEPEMPQAQPSRSVPLRPTASRTAQAAPQEDQDEAVVRNFLRGAGALTRK